MTIENLGTSRLDSLSTLDSIRWKASTRVATTGNITLSGEQTIDGVSVLDGDRVLVKEQSTGSENGIYIAKVGAWVRATDFDENSEVDQAAVFAREGTTNADTAWVITNDGTITVGSSSITFQQFSRNQVSLNGGILAGGFFNTTDGVQRFRPLPNVEDDTKGMGIEREINITLDFAVTVTRIRANVRNNNTTSSSSTAIRDDETDAQALSLGTTTGRKDTGAVSVSIAAGSLVATRHTPGSVHLLQYAYLVVYA